MLHNLNPLPCTSYTTAYCTTYPPCCTLHYCTIVHYTT